MPIKTLKQICHLFVIIDGEDSNELFVLQFEVGSVYFAPRDLNLLIIDPHSVFPENLEWTIGPKSRTCLKLALMCHFSMVQGVLLLRHTSKTLFEKKAMKSLAEAELLIMLSSGRIMSLCLQMHFFIKQKTHSMQLAYFSTFSSV